MTLSAADATAHIIENPLFPHWLHHSIGLTLVLLGILGSIFLVGFREAIGVAVLLVASLTVWEPGTPSYLLLNMVVIATGIYEIARHPDVLVSWREHLLETHGSIGGMLAVALLVFPKLALGLSGFETGVAVMPLVKGDVPQRIRNTRKLLITAALIMSVFLLGSSVVSSMLIEPMSSRKADRRMAARWPSLLIATLATRLGRPTTSAPF
jgi:hypothetical protein